MKIGDTIIAIDSRNAKHSWTTVLGEVREIEKDEMGVGIIILDSKYPNVNPDGKYGMLWGDGIRWYPKDEIEVIESI